MKTTNEIIELMEKDFVEHTKLQDSYAEEQIKNRGKDEYLYEHFKKSAQIEASICCYIARILGEINETNEDREINRLYAKYKLYK